MHRSRILIADDHNLVAQLCKNFLQSEFDVVGTVSNGMLWYGRPRNSSRT